MALRHEYQVASTYPPERALEIFHNGDFDLVITALQMPKLSGFEILRAVQETNPVVEVILLTGEIPDRAEPAVQIPQHGANRYLLKPVRIKELKEAVASSLASQRRRLEDKRHLQELVGFICTDSLTGLSNRRHFESQFDLEFERSERYDRPLSCLILDIDDFQKINVTFGHRMGDRVLQQVGNLLLHSFRTSDLKCRYGGEEFILLAPEADKDVALSISEKLRRLIYKEVFAFTDSPAQLTGSIGLATYWRKNFLSASELLQAAEVGLVKAKQEGKNCVRTCAPRLLHSLRKPVSLPNKG